MESKGIDFEKLGSEDLNGRENEKVWRWSVSGAGETFSNRAWKAGFEKGLLSYRSLRSGFLCSALLKAGKNDQSALEKTAFVAGWQVGGTG